MCGAGAPRAGLGQRSLLLSLPSALHVGINIPLSHSSCWPSLNRFGATLLACVWSPVPLPIPCQAGAAGAELPRAQPRPGRVWGSDRHPQRFLWGLRTPPEPCNNSGLPETPPALPLGTPNQTDLGSFGAHKARPNAAFWVLKTNLAKYRNGD